MEQIRSPNNIPFDPIRGRVFLQKKAPFTYPAETLHDHSQLAQFHPRTEHATAPIPQDTYYNVNVADVPNLSTVARDYENLPPMPAFRTRHQPGMYNDLSWDYHIAQCHNMYYYDLEREEGMGHTQMQSLLAIVSYGMGQSMTWLPPFTIPAHGEDLAYLTWSCTEFSGMVMGDGSYDYAADRHVATGLNVDYRKRIWGKRWLVVPITFPPPTEDSCGHSAMSIFDRECGHLYIQDTAYGECPLHRDERVQSIVHVWARFWNHMGLAHHFQYYVRKGTPQPYNFECGWLGVLWAMKNLRDQVGEQMLASGPDMQPDLVWFRDVPIGTHEPENYPYEDSSLYLSDWKPEGWINPKRGVEHMRQIFYAMLANELGIDRPTLITPMDVIQRTNHMATLMKDPLGIPCDEFWTQFGGPQFVLPRTWTRANSQAPKPYNRNTSRRLHPPQYPFEGLNGRRPIILNTPISHNPPRPFNATFNGKACTTDYPIVRRNHPPILGTGSIKVIWEDPQYGVWDHSVAVFNSQGTDENGREKGAWHSPQLRLQFAKEISENKTSVRVKYRASFMGGDLSSDVGHFDIFLGGKVVETNDNDAPEGYGYSSESTNWTQSNFSDSEDGGPPAVDPKDRNVAGENSPSGQGGWGSNLPNWSDIEPTASEDSEQPVSPSGSFASGKRDAVDSVETLQQEQDWNEKKHRSHKSPNSGSSSPSPTKQRRPERKRNTPSPQRKSSRVKKLTQLYDNMERY